MRPVNKMITNYLIAGALLPAVLSCGTCYNSSPGKAYSVCTNSECTKRGNMYHKNMNTHGNPCEDFFDYACGNWIKQNPRPSYQLVWSIHNVMQRKVIVQLQSILKKPAKQTDSKHLQSAKRLYKVCTQIPSLGRGNIDFVVNHMKKVGLHSEKRLWDIHNGYLKLTGESPLFDIQIIADDQHNDEPLLQFKDKKSPYGSLVFLGTWSTEQKRKYFVFLVNLMKSIQNGINPTLRETAIIQIINEVIRLRNQLNKISRASIIEPSDPPEPLTVTESMQWYNRYVKLRRSAQITWESVVRNLYSAVSDAALLANPIVGFRRKAYFIALADLLGKTPKETLAYHFQLYFAERHLKFTPEMLESLNDIVTKMNGFAGYVRDEEMDRSLKCINEMDSDQAEGKLYVEHFFNKNNIPAVGNMLEELRRVIKKEIMDSEWLDLKSKSISTRRIDDIKWWIGYPPWYDDPSLKAESKFMKPSQINAYLAINENRICINAALMNSPLFDPSLPAAINYGAIGATMGHEMYHALDECGSRQEKGVVNIWWPNAMREQCHIRKECFIKQYSEFAIDEIKSQHLNHFTPGALAYTSNTAQTLREDLVDVMGLQAAFHAYQVQFMKDKTACAVLPHFERFTCEQMFFISFANSMCGYQIPQMAFSTRRTHSPFRLRVNGAVANNEDFSQAFGCAVNSTMNPWKKCNLWI